MTENDRPSSEDEIPEDDTISSPAATTPAEDATLPASRSPETGKSAAVGEKLSYFGDYELLEEIARGGMGVVYKARQINLNRIVAIKMILAGQLAGEKDIQRFKTEAEAAANLDFPGIVPIFEIGYHEGQHYFSMGYVEGDSLAQRISDGPLAATIAAELGKKISDAMDYSHQRGVIHRDLKPANVLLDAHDQPKITDFGLAKKIEGDSNLTGTGQILGTPSYMAPEQACGKTDEIGPLADIYAIGAILYCLLSGRPPFQAANPMDTLLQVLEKEPVPLRKINSSIPIDLETICVKCLNKEPNKRYQSAGELSEELERFLKGEPIYARPVSRIERSWRWVKRRPMLASLSAAVLLLASVLAVGGPIAAVRQARLKSEAVANSQRANVSEKRERRQRQRAESGLYLSDIRLAAFYLQAERHADAHERLLQHVPDTGQTDRRGWEWNYLRGRSEPSLLSWEASSFNIPSIAWSPDGTRLATTQWKGGATMVWDANDGQKLLSLPEGTTIKNGLDWHPSSNQLAWGSVPNDTQLRIYDLDDGSMTRLKEDTGSHRYVRFSPDGTRIAVGAIKLDGDHNAHLKTIAVWEKNDGKWRTLSKVRTDEGSGINVVAWNPTGSKLVAAGRYSPAFVMNPNTLDVLRKTTESGFCSASWHPKLPLLACGTRTGEICLFDSETMVVLRRFEAHLGDVNSVAWSPDGKFLVSGSADQSVKVWEGDELKSVSRFVGHRGIVNQVCWNPDSTQVASCGFDGRVNIWPREPTKTALKIQFREKEMDGTIANRRRFAWIDNQTIRASSTTSEFIERDTRTGTIRNRTPLHGKGWRVLSANQVYRFLRTGGIAVANTSDTSRYVFIESTRNLWANAFSGRLVAYCEHQLESPSANGHFFVRDLQSNHETELGEQPLSMIGDVQWSPDQKWIAAVGGGVPSDGGTAQYSGWVNLFDAELGTLSHRSRIGSSRILGFSVAWRSDSQVIVAGNQDGMCQVYKAPDLETTFSKRLHRLAVQSLSWHPTEDRIASGSDDRTVLIWDSNTGEVFLTFTLDDPVEHVEWSPNGRRLAAMDVTGIIHVWDATNGVELSNGD